MKKPISKYRWPIILPNFTGNPIIRFLFLVSIFLYGFYARAQNDFWTQKKPRIKHFVVQDGLSQMAITSLVKGRSGFIWVASQSGLNHFDGHEFKQYHQTNSDTTSICGNYVNKLLIDKKGKICSVGRYDLVLYVLI